MLISFRKRIVRIGTSAGIILSKKLRKTWNIEIGDVMSFEISGLRFNGLVQPIGNSRGFIVPKHIRDGLNLKAGSRESGEKGDEVEIEFESDDINRDGRDEYQEKLSEKMGSSEFFKKFKASRKPRRRKF